MAGSRGPVPKRSSQRRRRNKEGGEVTSGVSGVVVEQPPHDEEWHPLAVDWYTALANSGQAVYYEASDWAQARIWAEIISRQLRSEKPNAQMVTAWASGATELMTTEGARRRMRLELEREGPVDEDEDASVLALADYKKQLG